MLLNCFKIIEIFEDFNFIDRKSVRETISTFNENSYKLNAKGNNKKCKMFNPDAQRYYYHTTKVFKEFISVCSYVTFKKSTVILLFQFPHYNKSLRDLFIVNNLYTRLSLSILLPKVLIDLIIDYINIEIKCKFILIKDLNNFFNITSLNFKELFNIKKKHINYFYENFDRFKLLNKEFIYLEIYKNNIMSKPALIADLKELTEEAIKDHFEIFYR